MPWASAPHANVFRKASGWLLAGSFWGLCDNTMCPCWPLTFATNDGPIWINITCGETRGLCVWLFDGVIFGVQLNVRGRNRFYTLFERFSKGHLTPTFSPPQLRWVCYSVKAPISIRKPVGWLVDRLLHQLRRPQRWIPLLWRRRCVLLLQCIRAEGFVHL